MRSGRYRVWSLTWDDVQEQFRFPVPRFEPELMSPGAKFGALVANSTRESGNWKSLSGLSSFGILMFLLGAGEVVLDQLCAGIRDQSARKRPGHSRPAALRLQRSIPMGARYLTLKAAWRRQLCRSATLGPNVPAAVRRYAHHGITEWKRAWREFLRLGNLLQFLVRLEFVSSLGLVDQLYSRSMTGARDTRTQKAVPDRPPLSWNW